MVAELMRRYNRFYSLQVTNVQYNKLVAERFSLWEKLLKENPTDVANSLRMEFAVILKTLRVINEIPKLENEK